MIESGVDRTWNNEEGPPSSDRIVHDVLQAIYALYTVYKAKGHIVPGLCEQNGRHNESGQRGRWVVSV